MGRLGPGEEAAGGLPAEDASLNYFTSEFVHFLQEDGLQSMAEHSGLFPDDAMLNSISRLHGDTDLAATPLKEIKSSLKSTNEVDSLTGWSSGTGFGANSAGYLGGITNTAPAYTSGPGNSAPADSVNPSSPQSLSHQWAASPEKKRNGAFGKLLGAAEAVSPTHSRHSNSIGPSSSVGGGGSGGNPLDTLPFMTPGGSQTLAPTGSGSAAIAAIAGSGGSAAGGSAAANKRRRTLSSQGFGAAVSESPYPPVSSEKSSKGLRHFSTKVCDKVRAKGRTTYNEVADELVREFSTSDGSPSEHASSDQKNIRRRVYDALNVLMAMNIIAKVKKEIRWIGLPSNAGTELRDLESERNAREELVERKRAHLSDLIAQLIAFQRLVGRNEAAERSATDLSVSPASNVGGNDRNVSGQIHLPFIVVNTSQETIIHCDMSEDRENVAFTFDRPFELHDDTEILRRMGMTKATSEELESILSPELMNFVPAESVLSPGNGRGRRRR